MILRYVARFFIRAPLRSRTEYKYQPYFVEDTASKKKAGLKTPLKNIFFIVIPHKMAKMALFAFLNCQALVLYHINDFHNLLNGLTRQNIH